MHQAQINANIIPQTESVGEETGRVFSRLLADVMFGCHLKLSGTIVMHGVQAPICEGDNAEVDGVIYHIERISHTAQRYPTGAKSFVTTLQVSSGISTESDGLEETVYPDGSRTPKTFTPLTEEPIDTTESTLFGYNFEGE